MKTGKPTRLSEKLNAELDTIRAEHVASISSQLKSFRIDLKNIVGAAKHAIASDTHRFQTETASMFETRLRSIRLSLTISPWLIAGMVLAGIASMMALAETAAQDHHGYQVAAINRGLLTGHHNGMANSQNTIDDKTLFQVASCSKTATALAVLTLVRDGRVDLDVPVNRYLDSWQLPGPRGGVATIAELMSHTARTTVHGFAGYGPEEDLPTVHDILAGRGPANSDPIRAQRRILGRFKYSVGGTMVLQSLIEAVTGLDFATYTTNEVLKPIGASHANFAITPVRPFAHGSYENGQALEGGFRRHPESAAAGLWATASDLANLFHAVLQALAGARHAIVPTVLAERMVTPISQGAGLGVFVSSGQTISHQGRNLGFDSVVVAELSTGRVRAAVTNRNGAIDRYARQLLAE